MFGQGNFTNFELDEDQMETELGVCAAMTHEDHLDSNADGVGSTFSVTAVESVESYLLSSLKHYREENKRLAEEYHRLKDCCETKEREKLTNLQMMNMPSNSDELSLLKVINIKQLNVIDKLKNLIDEDNQLVESYDGHRKTAIRRSEEQHQLDKQEHGFDQLTSMSHLELMNMANNIEQNIFSNETNTRQLTSQLKFEEAVHKAELNSIKKDMNTLEDVLRDTSQLIQDLQFKVTQQRRLGGTDLD